MDDPPSEEFRTVAIHLCVITGNGKVTLPAAVRRAFDLNLGDHGDVHMEIGDIPTRCGALRSQTAIRPVLSSMYLHLTRTCAP